MKKCNYIIKNIKGGNGEISIPSFNLLTTDDFKDVLSNYNNDGTITITDDERDNLKSLLNDYIPFNDTEDLIGESTSINLKNIIDKVNSEIISNVGSDNLYEVIKKTFNKNSNRKNEIEKFIKALSITPNKVEAKLFSDINPEFNSLANTSLNNEIRSLKNSIQDAEYQGLPTSYFEKLHSFLNLSNEFFNWKSLDNLIKIDGERLKEGNWNLENSIVYSDSPDKEYLFMGLFKRLASELSPDQFKEVFKDWNTLLNDKKYEKYYLNLDNLDVHKFFTGNLNKESTESPEFDKILDLSKLPLTKIKTITNLVYNKLFTEIANNVSSRLNLSQEESNELKNIIGELFARINPNTISSNQINKLLEDEKEITSTSSKINKQLLHTSLLDLKRMTDTFSGTKLNSLGEKYQQSILINPKSTKSTYIDRFGKERTKEFKNIVNTESVYNYLMNTLLIGKDIIKMPNPTFKSDKLGIKEKDNGKWSYYIVNAIYPSENGVKVYGQRLSLDGNLVNQNHTFSNTDEINLRKYDDFSETEESLIKENKPIILAEANKNAVSMLMPRGMTFNLAKNILSVGDLVGNRRVLGIYPGYIHYFDSSTNSDYTKAYDSEVNEQTFNQSQVGLSKKMYELFNSGENFYTSDDKRELKDQDSIANLSDGDYFKVEGQDGFKKIIYSDNKYVWGFVSFEKNGNNYVTLKPYNRDSIISGIVSNPLNIKDLNEISDLINENNKRIGSKSNLSTFYNSINAKEGDFIIYSKEDSTYYGKIISKEKEIALLWNPKTKSWEKINYSGLNVKSMSKDLRITNFSIPSMISNFWNSKTKSWEKINYSGLNVKFMSKDSRITNSSIPSMISNFWNVKMLNTNKTPDGYKKVKYVVSNNLDRNFISEKMSNFVLNSLYTEIGKYVEESFVDSNSIDLTDHIIKKLGGNPEIHSLYVPYTGTNIYERNSSNANLVKINGIENIDSEFFRKEMLSKGMYFTTFGDSDLYQIDKIIDNTLYARKYFRNESGDILMSEKKYNVDNLINLSLQNDGKRLNNSISRFYVQKGNNKFSLIINEANKNNKPVEQDITKRSLEKLKSNLSNFFEQINIPIIETEDNSEFIKGQKAKLTTKEDGSSILTLKKDLGTRDDLVHETMHLFLGALRYINPEAYMKVLNSFDTSALESGSLLDKEESFLNSISDKITELEDSFFSSNIKSGDLINALHLVGVNINPELLQDLENKDLLTVLKTPIIDFLDLEDVSRGDALYNSNLAQITPAFMRWLENEQINLKCI